LRNLAVAALALPDLRAAPEWVDIPNEEGWTGTGLYVDPRLRLAAIVHPRGKVSLRRIGRGASPREEFARLPGLGPGTMGVWGPDGHYLAVWNRQALEHLQVWRVDEDKATLQFEPPGACLALAFAPDGQRLVVLGTGGLLSQFDLRTGKTVHAVALQR